MDLNKNSEEKKPQITNQMQILDKELANLEESFLALKDRLKPISSNHDNPTLTLDSSDKKQEQLVPLAEDLNSYIYKIRVLSQSIRNVTKIIEL